MMLILGNFVNFIYIEVLIILKFLFFFNFLALIGIIKEIRFAFWGQ